MTPSPGGGPSVERLLRLLEIIPAAIRPGGVTFDELARRLGVDAATVEHDVRELLDRSAYLDPGAAGNLQAEVTHDGVEIWTPGPFSRPPRLRPDEALALALGLRGRALLRGRSPEDESRALLERLEDALCAEAPGRSELPIEDVSADSPGGRLRDRLLDALADRRVVELHYLKPGAPGPEIRRLEPAAVVHAEGRWYVLGRDPGADGLRAFRLDRVLDLADTGERFTPVDHPELEALDRSTRMYIPGESDAQEVPVVYSPRIARWIRERYEGEALDDGSLRVVHRVSDPDWLVRHVLQYAGEARAEPPGAAWVRATLEPEGERGSRS